MPPPSGLGSPVGGWEQAHGLEWVATASCSGLGELIQESYLLRLSFPSLTPAWKGTGYSKGSVSHLTAKNNHMWTLWSGGHGVGGHVFGGALECMGLIKGHPMGWWPCVRWQTLGSVVHDFWSPRCQGVALQLSHVDSSLALWEGGTGRGDPSIVSTWTRLSSSSCSCLAWAKTI